MWPGSGFSFFLFCYSRQTNCSEVSSTHDTVVTVLNGSQGSAETFPARVYLKVSNCTNCVFCTYNGLPLPLEISVMIVLSAATGKRVNMFEWKKLLEMTQILLTFVLKILLLAEATQAEIHWWQGCQQFACRVSLTISKISLSCLFYIWDSWFSW